MGRSQYIRISSSIKTVGHLDVKNMKSYKSYKNHNND